jgi:4-hydroxy-3-polyprenylbenzoate decarboxylase
VTVPRRLVVGISGATGIAYGVRVLELARAAGLETHLVVTPAGQQTREYETDLTARDLAALADVSHRPADIGAAIASGSFRTAGMIVAPCSIRTLSAIAYSNGDNLLTRAADVSLKERRRLVLLVREAPLTLGHLRAMTAVTETGGIVMPPVPAFYLRPASVGDIVEHTAGRALDLLGIEVPGLLRWGEQPVPANTATDKESA